MRCGGFIAVVCWPDSLGSCGASFLPQLLASSAGSLPRLAVCCLADMLPFSCQLKSTEGNNGRSNGPTSRTPFIVAQKMCLARTLLLMSAGAKRPSMKKMRASIVKNGREVPESIRWRHCWWSYHGGRIVSSLRSLTAGWPFGQSFN
jgi:hypothetical protein